MLSMIVLTRKLWELTFGVCLFIFIASAVASIGSYFAVQVTLGVLEYGEEKVEQRDKRVKDDLGQLL